jgi:hypothetical protein
VLFVIALSEVEELLASTVQIWHVFHLGEHLHVLFEGDHCDKACNLFNRVRILLNVEICCLLWR